VDRERQQPQNLPACRADRRGADEEAAPGVDDELDQPGVPGPCTNPREDAATSAAPTATGIPAARAAASVAPTEPTSGSVKVTRGSAV
jgi:hypothetical protein